MRKIIEVLRLRAAGRSAREIALAAGAARSTVAEYLRRADAAGIAWPLSEELDDEALETRLFPPASQVPARPDWSEFHKELRAKRHVTLRLLWLERKKAHPDGWGYSQFCLHCRAWLSTKDVVMRPSYAAGERTFVDGRQGALV